MIAKALVTLIREVLADRTKKTGDHDPNIICRSALLQARSLHQLYSGPE